MTIGGKAELNLRKNSGIVSKRSNTAVSDLVSPTDEPPLSWPRHRCDRLPHFWVVRRVLAAGELNSLEAYFLRPQRDPLAMQEGVEKVELLP